MNDVVKKFSTSSTVVGIIGLGYVGLPLAHRFAMSGLKVIGFDIDPDKIAILASGKTYIQHIRPETIQEMLRRKFLPTCDFSKIKEVDAIIICVPTPLNRYKEPDLTYIIGSMNSIAPYLRDGQLLSLESTTYPGTTDEEIVTRIEQLGFKVGQNYFVVYCPEREDPGNETFGLQSIPKIIGGHSDTCLAAGTALYAQVIDKLVQVSSTRAAEMTKLLENIHRAVNIGLVNEMKIVADKMGLDIHEIIAAASSKPFGFVPYYPGPGVGGHCIPIDPFYLTWKAREFGIRTRFIELAGEINDFMPKYFVNQISIALNEQHKAIKGSKILILGISYKKNVDDARESPSVFMMDLLREMGAALSYSDPYFPHFPKMREHTYDLDSLSLGRSVLENFDCVVIATDHDQFDYDMINAHSKILIDTRGILKKFGYRS
ncbi:nucleotide sugar dehydrogenase [Rickettsiales endosymbiont of Peranema trichophorum]|uniref:nucleotide sugar dehydrogenase n=1 Tax=Rickettsiales endosymbiont of Peranema trichophorum TaxID=2486577 RepID=UPI001023A66B|nr:nucleotide sugar dehydrogenase [Rickettsiales endosymbiont of Peranema trichophorum]RZI47563.1 nucleotide sugar dehydrogenase [Rickettsiales endosymbiont of Peranema trichophorum]